MRPGKALATAVVIGLFLLTCSCVPEQKRVPTWDLEGELAPEISASAWYNADKPLTLSQFRKEKFVLLVFWFTKCPHCVAEVPRIEDFHYRFTGPKFQVVTIVSNLKDDRKTVEEFIKEHHVTFPTAIDEGGKTFGEYAMRTVPFAYLINRYGYVIWQGHPHYLEAQRISEMLRFAE